MLQGFGKPDGKRDAAVSAYGKQFEVTELELNDAEDAEDPIEMARRAAGKGGTPSPKPAAGVGLSDVRPTLEPISDDTHKHRRLPTQPPSALALELDIDRPPEHAASEQASSEQASSEPAAARSVSSAPINSVAQVSPVAPARPPSTAGSRQSPSPVRRGVFSGDRVTNFLASAAVGLVIMIFPAKQFAHSYEISKVEPMLADLEGAIDHPLGVQAGLVADPQKIAAQIHEGREDVRRRYMAIWLLVGLPLGVGLGFAPRPGD